MSSSTSPSDLEGMTMVTIPSPFSRNISFFDDEDSFPDMKFLILGTEKPLLLHRRELGIGSKTLGGLLKGETSPYATFDPSTQCITWGCETAVANSTYRNVLVKWLRFCYGEEQVFTADECPVALTVCSQLQLGVKSKQEDGDVRSQMEVRMVSTARRNADAGADMLSACLRLLRWIDEGIPVGSCDFTDTSKKETDTRRGE